MGKSSMQSGAFKYIVALCLLYPGSAIFTINPNNVTTCLGSPAVLTCVTDVSLPINWLINGTAVQSPPPTTPLTPGPGSQSTLSVNVTSELNGASVQCYYTPSVLLPSIVSLPAYLSVQAPPSAPTNLITTALNATSVLLAWGPPSGAQSPSLFYRVLVTSGNGTLVYYKTLKELQLILTTPDPCDQYWANVTTVYVNLNSIVCTGSSIMNAINGGPPPSSVSFPDASYEYPNSSRDNVNVTWSLYSKIGICYTIRAVPENGTETSFNKSYVSTGGIINISLSLPPLQHFNVCITAYNMYGKNPTCKRISTFNVINVTANTSALKCEYNPGSLAKGCVVHLRNTSALKCEYNPGSLAKGCVVHLKNTTSSEITYCMVILKSKDLQVPASLCPSYFNDSLTKGIYLVDAFDIFNDGNKSPIPAVNGTRLNLTTALLQDTTSTTTSSTSSGVIVGGAIVGGVIGGVIGGVAVMLLVVIIMVVVNKKHLRVVTVQPSYVETHSPTSTANSEQSENNHSTETHSQNSVHSLKSNANSPSVQSENSLLGNHEMDKTTMNTKEVSHYRVIDFEAKRAIPPPPLDTTVTYATVQSHA